MNAMILSGCKRRHVPPLAPGGAVLHRWISADGALEIELGRRGDGRFVVLSRLVEIPEEGDPPIPAGEEYVDVLEVLLIDQKHPAIGRFRRAVNAALAHGDGPPCPV